MSWKKKQQITTLYCLFLDGWRAAPVFSYSLFLDGWRAAPLCSYCLFLDGWRVTSLLNYGLFLADWHAAPLFSYCLLLDGWRAPCLEELVAKSSTSFWMEMPSVKCVRELVCFPSASI